MPDQSTTRVRNALFWTVAAFIGVALWTPLIISSRTIYPFQTGKGFAFRILIELASFFYFWLCLVDPSARPRRGTLLWSILAYSAVLLVTTFTGVNPFRSFWGNLERMEGVFGILHGVLLFVIVSGLFKKREDWIRFLVVSLTASVVVCWYALAQVSPQLRVASVYGITNVQPGSTLGFHSFLAEYLIFQIFFSVLLLIWMRQSWWRAFAGTTLLLNSLVLVLTGVRGAWVGMLASLGVGALLVLFVVRRSRKDLLLAAGSIVTILAISALAYGLLPTDSPFRFAVDRLATTSLDKPTAKTRLLSDLVSWRAFKERPVLGWGQENFEIAYDKYFNPEQLSYERAWFDRAHNKIAGVSVQTGLAGLAAYLLPFAILLLELISVLKTPRTLTDKFAAIVMIMLGVAYFIQNIFLFDTSVSLMFFFSALALAHHVAKELSAMSPVSAVGGWKSFSRRRRVGATVLLGAAGIVICVLVPGANVLPYRQAVLGGKILGAQTPVEALFLCRRAIRYRSFATPELLVAMMNTLERGRRAETEAWGDVTAFVCEHAETLIARDSSNPRFLLKLGMLYNEGANIDSSRFLEARRVLLQGARVAPLRPEFYSEIGKSFFGEKRPQEGMAWFRKAVALNELYPHSHWMLGLAYVKHHEAWKGMVEMEKAISLGYDWDNPIDIENMTRVYTSLQLYRSLAQFYLEVVRRHPDNRGYQLALATAEIDSRRTE